MKFKILIFIVIISKGMLPSFSMDMDLKNHLTPYYLIRSLQRVFDSAVTGDNYSSKSISELLEETGKQLQTTNIDVFIDYRNVDAILIYTIISDNISILESLFAKDSKGYFNNIIIHALREYHLGNFESSVKELERIKDKYSTRGIDAYLYFLMGNAMLQVNSEAAIRYFDQVRVLSPGTMLEEIALRSLLQITLNRCMYERAFIYINDYSRQFHNSIYKDKFISLLLRFFEYRHFKLQDNDIISTISFFDFNDQRNIYLKIARYSAINGNFRLGSLAIKNLKNMYSVLNSRDIAAVWLYTDLMNIPFIDIISLQHSLYNIPDNFLIPQDIILKNASEVIISDIKEERLGDDVELIDKNLVLETEQLVDINFDLGSFINTNRKKVETIDRIIDEKE